MRKCTYNLLGTARVLFTALIATVWLASCSSTRHSASVTSASRTTPIVSEASHPVIGAAAQSQSTSSVQAAQSDGEDEILASTAAPKAAATNSQQRLKEKLGQLNSQLAKAPQAVKSDVKAKKLSFPVKLLVNKLVKKTSRLSQKSTTQIGAQEATQDSNSSLLIVGLLITIVGLLLTLLTVGTSQTIGIIALIVGIVISILALVG